MPAVDADVDTIPSLDEIRAMPPVAGYTRFLALERRHGRQQLEARWEIAPNRYRGVKGRMAAKASAGGRPGTKAAARRGTRRRTEPALPPSRPAGQGPSAARSAGTALIDSPFEATLSPIDRLRVIAQDLRKLADDLEGWAGTNGNLVDMAEKLRAVARSS